jgi:hypothetical protein
VVLIALAVYLTAAVVLLTPIRHAFGDSERAAPLPPPPAAAADPEAGPDAPAPELAAADRVRARSILAADPALARALGATAHTIVQEGPWTTSGADGSAPHLLGAAFVVAPRTPVDLKAVSLPGALYDQTEKADPPYQDVVNEVSGRQVTQLLVLVDLERGRVVNITPGPETRGLESERPPGFRRTVPVPRDGSR